MDTPPPLNPEPQPPAIPPAPSGPTEEQWKVILHLTGLAGLLFPFGNVLAPLVIWLIKKTDLPGLDVEGRKVLNFQISYSIYILAMGFMWLPLSCLAAPLLLIICVAWLIFTIVGSVKASNGEEYQFPLTIKML